MALKHWILGGLGYALGGPIGAIIGVVIASLFDSAKALPTNEEYSSHTTTRSGSTRQKPTANDIRISILILIAAVMKADGHVKKSELDVVKAFLRQNYGDEEGREALQVLKQLLNQNINHVAVAYQVKNNLNYSTRLEIVHLLLELANADGDFHAQEQLVIEQISDGLGITESDYNSLLALYGKQKDPEWMYKALDITAEATDDEVKKAYRKMAMKYHPDKLASAPEEMKQKATEKFRDVQKAYETIKAARGFK